MKCMMSLAFASHIPHCQSSSSHNHCRLFIHTQIIIIFINLVPRLPLLSFLLLLNLSTFSPLSFCWLSSVFIFCEWFFLRCCTINFISMDFPLNFLRFSFFSTAMTSVVTLFLFPQPCEPAWHMVDLFRLYFSSLAREIDSEVDERKRDKCASAQKRHQMRNIKYSE